MMDHSISIEPRDRSTRNETVNATRALWISIILSIVGVSSFGVGIFLAFNYPHWQVYAMLFTATLASFFDILGVALSRHGRAETAAKVLYWSCLLTIPVNGLLFQGVTVYLAPMILFIEFALIYMLFPRSSRRSAIPGPVIAALIMFLVDYLNPPFRYNFGTLWTTSYFGPLMLGVMVVGILALIIRQRFVLIRFLSNISVAWKMVVMVIVLFLGMLGITAAGYQGVQSMRYQFSNIYDFMLIPITSIGGADTSLTDAQYQITQLLRRDITAEVRSGSVQQLLADNQSVSDVVARYDKEWVTTTSPDFTQALRKAGKIELQQQEVSTLAALHTALDDYTAALNPYLKTAEAGIPDATLADQAAQKLDKAHSDLRQLIDINNQFADFSNTEAQAAIGQALFSGGIVLGISLFLGLFISYLIAISINTRLGDLNRSAAAMQQGKLDQTVALAGRDEISLLGSTFNAMAGQLKELISSLEQRVADRTKALTTSAEVTRRLAAVTNPRQLATEVVEQVQQAFNYYHAHIYFLDEATGDLVMAGGTGEAGAALLARGHRLPKGRGLVGRAADTNTSVLVADVSKEPGWLPNPLLPDTQSEAAIPISSGQQVLGVLDVQQNEVHGLDENDVELLESLAGQVAISLRNARTFEQSRAQAEHEALVNAIGQKIQRAGTVEEVLQTAVREIGSALGASRVKVNITRSAPGQTAE